MLNQQMAGRFDHWLWNRQAFDFHSNRHWLWNRQSLNFVVVQRIPLHGAECRRRRMPGEVSMLVEQ